MKIQAAGLASATGERFPLIPVGQYPVRIVKVDTEKVTGAESKYPGSPMLNLQCKIQEGNDHANAMLFLTICLPGEKADAEYNARGINQLKRLLIACKIPVEGDDLDTNDLMGAEFKANVTVRKNKQTGEDQSQIGDTLPL